ncbi:hypothetical protein TVAG_107580 [Trichomonas vaginalis G3]|uniref:Uncharacterized protein n=1 Tax=Trichomonas vaginalis (strain ATCC PRA-98 / G3) TaxID=412133 RepID=A2F0Q4_TRIV3|nr:ankyrin repeat protein family [Trichomonas vaginalis G3]EAY01499.1 hypothetical protein TVAG_107580 [Trichomonas vaginalis G3]KAI5482196.1 ankyrin repeat protein family [Trichomonas vaginalis G3]|eukprot:XP_001314184.1 hypothetical protein [Trichomonas vaginalis G3]
MNLDFEYIAAHISDYIKNENFFDTFEIGDIKTIMKYSQLTADQYVTLLKQSSSTIDAKALYVCTRKTNVTIQNVEEIVSILNSLKKYMKFNIFDGIIDVLNQREKIISDFTTAINRFQNQSQTNENNNHSRDILTKIAELKNSNDFDSVYKFFDELSEQGNQEMMLKSYEEELWKKTMPKKDDAKSEKNVFHAACEKGNLKLVKSLIECGCDKEANDNNYGNTPLIWASGNGNLEVVKYLISIGANKEARDKDGNAPLSWASGYNHLEVVKYLISIGSNKETRDKNGMTPLGWASRSGHLEVVKYLISEGLDKEEKDNIGSTPLIKASFGGALEVVKYLVSIGANKEAKDNIGSTPLIEASFYGHLEVVKYLVSIGANKEAKDKYGWTPLIKASAIGHLEIAKYLISVGADKEAKTNDGRTAFDVAKGSVKEYFLSI